MDAWFYILHIDQQESPQLSLFLKKSADTTVTVP